ncbi:MAG: hypothetical protein ACTJF0_02720 [Psychroflexus halocasei]
MDVKENYKTPDKIQDLLNLIDFLDENKTEFIKYNTVFLKNEAISKKMADLIPLDHYKKRLKHNELKKETIENYKIINENIKKPIKQKVQQLEITSFSDAADMKSLMFNKYFHDITDYVKAISSESEAEYLNDYKNKYLAFRTNETYKHNFWFGFFFDALDELLTELFKEFKDADNFTELCFFEPRLREVSKWTNKDYYNHYLKTKRFFDFSLLPKQGNKDFDELKDQLNKQNNVYKYIASKLDEFELIELKNDYEQRLKNAKDKQDLNKHKVLINYFIDQLNKEPQEADQLKEKKEVSYKTEYHVISYILDCKAKKIKLPISKKLKVEKDAKERSHYEGSPNTFYKKFNDHANHEINKSYLIDLIGSDWFEVVLNISNDKDTLRSYLKRHFV